jgi:hypothetical protein
LLPQPAPVFDDTATLSTALDMVDPQLMLMELLVRHVLLPRELLPQIEINSIVLGEGDDIGDSFFVTVIVAHDELQFDAHAGASPGSSDR